MRCVIVKQELRLDTLYQEIQKWTLKIPNSYIKVYRLFYTTKNEAYIEKFKIKDIIRAMFENEKKSWEKHLE